MKTSSTNSSSKAAPPSQIVSQRSQGVVHRFVWGLIRAPMENQIEPAQSNQGS